MAKSIKPSFLILLAATISLGAHFSPTLDAAEPFATDIYAYKNIKESEPLILKRYFPTSSRVNSPRPAIVFFFGGGWNGGSIIHLAPQSEHLASRGMIAICVEYRTKSSHGVTPDICLEDAWDAMRYVHKNARKLGIDPKRIAAGGGSAGGHLAAATAFCPTPSSKYKKVRPHALVLFNPVIDNGPDGYGYERVSAYWKKFSPLHNISFFLPPTLFLLGDQDALIPLETGRNFAAKMNRNEQRCTLKVYKGAAHGFFNKGRESENGKEYFQDCVDSMDTFLTQIGYLEK